MVRLVAAHERREANHDGYRHNQPAGAVEVPPHPRGIHRQPIGDDPGAGERAMRQQEDLAGRHCLGLPGPGAALLVLRNGSQHLRLFNGYCDKYGLQPIVVFDGDSRPVVALRGLVRAIRGRWPRVGILLRADSQYCAPEVLDFRRAECLDFTRGVATTRTQRCHVETLSRFHIVRTLTFTPSVVCVHSTISARVASDTWRTHSPSASPGPGGFAGVSHLRTCAITSPCRSRRVRAWITRHGLTPSLSPTAVVVPCANNTLSRRPCEYACPPAADPGLPSISLGSHVKHDITPSRASCDPSGRKMLSF